MRAFQYNCTLDRKNLKKDFRCVVTEEQVRFVIADEIVENDLLAKPETHRAYLFMQWN